MPPAGPARPADAPATRDQVDAYRFGLRRLEAALVRGDPVPMHEQIRAQRRAVAAGAVLGVLGLVAAYVTGVVSPPADWRDKDLVVGTPSGALYVVAHDPHRLVPVANAVAGRLVLAALRRPAPAAPRIVDDAVLADAPRTAPAPVDGAVAAEPARTPGPRWAVCDEAAAGPDGPRLVGTTVFAGGGPGADPPPTDPDGPSDGVLLAPADGAVWLVTDGSRHRLAPDDPGVRGALGLGSHVPRPASAGLVAALPEGAPLVTPAVPGLGGAGPAGPFGRVGDVLVSRPAAGPPRYHVVLRGGLQEVPPLVADVLSAAAGRPVVEIGPEVVAAAVPVRTLALAGWPSAAPRLREPAEAPVVCRTWSDADATTGVHLGPAPDGPAPVALPWADGPGEAADSAVVGAGGAVRVPAPETAGVPGAPAAPDPVWVLSAGGVAHEVADGPSAAALGVTAAAPAPAAALRLLPRGPALDVAQAARALGVPTVS